MVQANAVATPAPRASVPDTKQELHIRELERTLKKQEAQLAEAAALLILQEKSGSDLGKGQRKMISAPDRQEAIQLIAEAVGAGARQARACAVLRLSARTVQRWRHRPQDGSTRRTAHPSPHRSRQANAQPCWRQLTAQATPA